MPAARIDFVDLDDVAARALMIEHPSGTGSVEVRGSGSFATALVGALVRQPAPDGGRVLVVGPGSETRPAELESVTGAVHRGWRFEHGTAQEGIVYVAHADDERSLAEALALHQAGREVVMCLERAEPFRSALDGAHRPPVAGRLDLACDAHRLAEGSVVFRLARAIHERYLADAEARGEDADTNASAVPWEHLAPHLQQSNIAQAEHMREKLAKLGATVSRNRPELEVRLDAREIEHLAQLEHMRWCRERRAAGFTWGPSRTADHHPDLVDWEQLSDAAREKDRDIVRQVPGLLAAEGLHLVRRERADDGAPSRRGRR